MPDAAAPASLRNDLAVVLTGGGARAAYQVGFLRCLARVMPDLRFPIITGVSAGAINAVYLAAHPGTTAEAAEGLTRLWRNLQIEHVFRADSLSLLRHLLRWSFQLLSGGSSLGPQVRGFVDTAPLRAFLGNCLELDNGEIVGIQRNIERRRLDAVALTTLDYTTGRTVTWVQGRRIQGWERSYRRSEVARLTLDHVMASSSLPLFFPAVQLDDHWYGDGGVRLSAPLSPALHLGARRILAISTRYARSAEEAGRPETSGYPPPAQIAGNLMNAVFLDLLDQDLERAEKFNRLLARMPPAERGDLRILDIEVLRPSVDLGRLSADYENELPGAFRFLTRGLGTRETTSPDYLSLLMFEPAYLQRLIEIGEADAEARLDDLVRLVSEDREPSPR
jgi:NTE family protein